MTNFIINKILIPALALALFVSCGKKSTEPEPEPVPKIISGPEAVSISDKSATIAWTTDQKTDSKVKYGRTSASHDGEASSDGLVTEHSITLSGLEVYSSYYYIVVSSNANGTDTSAENTFTTQVNTQFLLDRAWPNFEQKQYLEALIDFKAALSISVNLSEAYLGSGWSYAFLDSLDEAQQQFDGAIFFDKQLLDAYVGRGMVLLSKNKYFLSIADLTYVLEKDSIYVFDRNTNIDYKDIHIALAEAYFYQAKYSKAQEQVDILWPENGLDPQKSSTWNIDSTAYATFQEALLSAIEKLKAIVK